MTTCADDVKIRSIPTLRGAAYISLTQSPTFRYVEFLDSVEERMDSQTVEEKRSHLLLSLATQAFAWATTTTLVGGGATPEANEGFLFQLSLRADRIYGILESYWRRNGGVEDGPAPGRGLTEESSTVLLPAATVKQSLLSILEAKKGDAPSSPDYSKTSVLDQGAGLRRRAVQAVQKMHGNLILGISKVEWGAEKGREGRMPVVHVTQYRRNKHSDHGKNDDVVSSVWGMPRRNVPGHGDSAAETERARALDGREGYAIWVANTTTTEGREVAGDRLLFQFSILMPSSATQNAPEELHAVGSGWAGEQPAQERGGKGRSRGNAKGGGKGKNQDRIRTATATGPTKTRQPVAVVDLYMKRTARKTMDGQNLLSSGQRRTERVLPGLTEAGAETAKAVLPGLTEAGTETTKAVLPGLTEAGTETTKAERIGGEKSPTSACQGILLPSSEGGRCSVGGKSGPGFLRGATAGGKGKTLVGCSFASCFQGVQRICSSVWSRQKGCMSAGPIEQVGCVGGGRRSLVI